MEEKTNVTIKVSYRPHDDMKKALDYLDKLIKNYPSMKFEIVLHWIDHE